MSFFSAIIFFVLPLIIFEIYKYLEISTQEKRNWTYITFFSYIVTGAAYAIWKQSLTIYELALVEAIVAIGIHLGWAVKDGCEKDKMDMVLSFTAFLSVVIAVYSIFTFGRVIINSDAATPVLLAKAIWEHHSFFPESWAYGNGDIWVLGPHILCMGFMYLFTDQSLARVVASVIVMIFTVMAMIWQSRKILGTRTYLLSIPVLLINLSVQSEKMPGWPVDAGLYQAIYLCHLLFFVLSSVFLYYADKDDKKYVVVYGLWLTLLLIGGVRYIAEQTLPAICTVTFLLWKKQGVEDIVSWRGFFLQWTKKILVILIPSGIGYGIYKWLCSWHEVNQTENSALVLVASLQTLFQNLGQVCINFYACFGFSGGCSVFSDLGIATLCSLGMCSLICFVIPYLQWKKIDQEPEGVQFFYYYGMIHNFILIAVIVLLGKIEVRYTLSSVYVFILVSSRYIYTYWICAKKQWKWILMVFLISSFIVGGKCILDRSAGWKLRLYEKKAFNQTLLERGLRKGYATYWNAYVNEIHTDLQIRYGAVLFANGGLAPYSWLTDCEVFSPEKDTKTFLLVEEKYKETVDSYIGISLDNPIDVFKNQEIYVYVFDHDIASDMCNGFNDEVVYPFELSVTKDGGIIRKERVEIVPGGTLFGPYAKLKRGKYRITFIGERFDACDYDIYTGKHHKDISYREIERNDNRIEVLVELTADVDDLECRLFNRSRTETVYLNKILETADMESITLSSKIFYESNCRN